MTNPWCSLAVIFCSFISHLIGHETINIPEILSGIDSFMGKTVTVLLPRQHTGFQTFPILKAFLATIGILFGYLQMVPHMQDPASI